MHGLVAQARSQWRAAILSQGLHVYVLSSPICAAGSSKRPIACPTRTYTSHPHVGAPPRFSRPRTPETVVLLSKLASESLTPRNVGSTTPEITQSLSARSSRPEPKAESSSLHTVTSESPKPNMKKKKLPEILVFHNPASTASVKMLNLLRQAQEAFPNTKRLTGPPLDFKLTVLERLPTVSELQDMYSFQNEGSWTVFHASASSSYRIHPTSARSLLEGIEYARQAEVAKAKQYAKQDNPPETAVTQLPSTDSPISDPSAAELLATSVTPNVDSPLFGTRIFSWPVIVCWSTKDVLPGANAKQVYRLLKGLADDRDDRVIKTKEEQEEQERKVRQARWTYPEREASPDEEDTLKWFNESSKKPVKKLSW